jgi:hypothetical protein
MKVWTDAAEAGLLDRRGERGRDCGHLKGTASLHESARRIRRNRKSHAATEHNPRPSIS